MNPNQAPRERSDFTRVAAAMRDHGEALVEAPAETLFNRHHTGTSNDANSIPETFLRVTVML